jgi:enoyl-CoA hydratase
MGISSSHTEDGITTVTLDFPPVNAVPAKGWFALADAVRDAGDDPATRVVVLRAEGRGFCAGVDIKEIQRTRG